MNIFKKSHELEMQEQGRDQTALLTQLVEKANHIPEKVLTRKERRGEALSQLMSQTIKSKNDNALSQVTDYYANR